MSAKLQQALALAQQQAAVSADMNEVDNSGGGGKLLPRGRFLGRIVEYIDLGTQPQSFKGQKKDPAPEFQLGVALWGKDVSEEDGTPYVFRGWPLKVSRNEKAKTFQAFKALNYTQNPEIKHFAQFLGQAFIFTLDRHVSKTTERESSIILWEQTAPAIDVVSGQPYPVPEVPDELYRTFFWDFPTLEDWSALFIEGTRDDGSSKNFIQEKILSAVNFPGSALDILLKRSGVQVQIPPPKEPQNAAGDVVALPQGGSTGQAVQTQPAASSQAVAVPPTQGVVQVDPNQQAQQQQVTTPLAQGGAANVTAPTSAPAPQDPFANSTTSPSNPLAGLPALPQV